MIKFKVTVDRHLPDKYGSETGVTAHTIPGCIDWPEASASTAGATIQTHTSRTLLAPPGADILDGDVVWLPDGSRWRVTADPFHWVSPLTGRKVGVAVQIERDK